MIIDKNIKIHEAASTDETREVINQIQVERRGNTVNDDGTIPARAIATDGRIMAVVPMELDDHDTGILESETGRMIPAAAWKSAVKGRKSVEGYLGLNGGIEVATQPGPPEMTVGYAPCDGSIYPNWRQVIPDGHTGRATLTINPDLLVRLARAIGVEKNEMVTIELLETARQIHGRGDNWITGALRVTANDGTVHGATGDNAPLGIIMPGRPS